MKDTIENLHIEQEVSMLHLALSSPESYTLEEKEAICEDFDAKTEALDDAIRAEFNAMSEQEQAAMLRLLVNAGTMPEGFWERLLL